MEIQKSALPEAGSVSCAQQAKTGVVTDGKDRVFLLLTAVFCVLLVDTLLFSQPGLGVLVSVGAWSVLELVYVGWARMRQRRESWFLLGVNLVIAATFALQSNWYFRIWNVGALLLLVPVQATSLVGRRPWWQASMLGERVYLLFQGLFGNLGAVGSAAMGKRQRGRRGWTVAVGVAAAAVAVLMLLPVLASADALFSSLTRSLVTWMEEHFTTGLVKVIAGLVMAPFVFSLLYGLRRKRETEKGKERAERRWDGLAFVILLVALVALYALFLGVQAAGLFGGEAYLAKRGIQYAQWARSGFFQMVGVTVVNLTVVLTALRFSNPTGRSWMAVRLLVTGLVGESMLLLTSAAWRMSLYVSVYGLSFKRCMTYWGMAMMAIFLVAAVVAAWRRGFCFCRVAFLAAVLGWMAICLVPVDGLVARDNVERYLSGRSATVSVEYLTSYDLSYDTLSQLERLDGTAKLSDYQGTDWGEQETLSDVVAARRADADRECQRWESWNLSAWRARG